MGSDRNSLLIKPLTIYNKTNNIEKNYMAKLVSIIAILKVSWVNSYMIVTQK